MATQMYVPQNILDENIPLPLTKYNLVTLVNNNGAPHMCAAPCDTGRAPHGAACLCVPCHPTQIARIFFDLMQDIDFSAEIRMLRVGFFERTVRKNLKMELNATYVGLWTLALTHSFPDAVEDIFAEFLDMYLATVPPAQKFIHAEKIIAYKEMVCHHGYKDFTEVSRHILSFIKIDEHNLKADVLRISLALRKHYGFIFQRLV